MQSVLSLLAASCLLAVPPGDEPPQLERFEFAQIQMGVPFQIALYAPDEAVANEAARAAFRRIKQLNTVMSDYDPDSELMRLCRTSGPGRPVKVSPDLLAVLRRAAEVSHRSGGAFDVSVGPVVQLWRKARRKKELPDPAALKAALAHVDWRAIRIDEKGGTVELLKPEMRLDLGGIAKGYAADAALKVLKEHGLTRAMVAGVGDMALGDPPPGRDGWRIGVAPLENPDAPPRRFLTLANIGVATSGDAYQFVEIGGTRYSHVVDPKSGLGVTRRSSSTVIAPDATTADALASAIGVLGPERGLKLIEQTDGAAALIVTLSDDAPQAVETPNFARYESRE